jgi:hypothetical protein
MERKLSPFRYSLRFFAVAFGLMFATPAMSEVHLDFNQMGRLQGLTYSFGVPGGLRRVLWSYSGKGKAVMTVAACRVPRNIGDNKPRGVIGDAELTTNRQFPAVMLRLSRGQSPDMQNCNWGAFVWCIDANGCNGRVTIWWERWDGTDDDRPRAKAERPVEDIKPSPSQPTDLGGVVDVGDAGTLNNYAAKIRYDCRVDGNILRGDYDAFTFEFSGGRMIVSSSGDLDLVADLLDDRGQMIARSGTETRQFRIEGTYRPGRYILQVRVMHHAGEGSYQIQLGASSNCLVREQY